MEDMEFIPSVGTIKILSTLEKELLSLLTKNRLGYYRKYLLNLTRCLNKKLLSGFKKNLQNKNNIQIENIIIKYLKKYRINFIEKPIKTKITRKLDKNLNKKRVYASRNSSNKQNLQILIHSHTKNDFKALKLSYGFKTNEDLLLYLLKNHFSPKFSY